MSPRTSPDRPSSRRARPDRRPASAAVAASAAIVSTCLTVAVACGAPTDLAAQGTAGGSTAGARIAAGVQLQTFSFGTPVAIGAQSATLLVTPIAARLVALPKLTLDVVGAYARGTVTDPSGTSLSLSGATDTEVRVGVPLDGQTNAFALSASAFLPTGHRTLGPGELAVASLVSSDLLPFRISNWGFGGGGSVEISALHGGDGGSVGFSAGYRLTTEFQPLAASAARYRPGDEASLGLTAQRNFAGGASLSVQLAASQFASDRWNGVSLLKPGQRYLAVAGLTLPAGNGSASLYGGVLYRSGGALSETLALSGLLAGVQAPPSEELYLAGGTVRLPVGAVVLVPGLDARALRRADGTGQGWLVSAGTSAELPLGSAAARLVPSVRLHLGRLLEAQGLDTGVRGVDLGLAISLGGAR